METGTYSFIRVSIEQKGQQEDDFYTKGDWNPTSSLKYREKTTGITAPSVFWEFNSGYKQKSVPLTNKFGNY